MPLQGFMKCPLLDDAMSRHLETDLLKRWGFSQEFADLCYTGSDLAVDTERIYNSAKDTQDQSSLQQDIKAGGKSESKETGQYYEGEKKNTVGIESSSDDSHGSDDWHDDVTSLYVEAAACFREGQYIDCVVYVDEALDVNGGSNTSSAPLWTLRARALNAEEDYLETLRAVASVKVENRPQELCVEGAIALYRLNMLYTAERWLRQIIDARTDKDNDGADHTPDNGSGEDDDDDDHDGGVWGVSCDPWVQRALHLFVTIRHARVHGAFLRDTPIKLTVHREGRSLQATRRIAQGELIFSELPDLLEQNIATHHLTACAHCGLSLVKPEDVFAKVHLGSSELQKVLKKLWPRRPVTPCTFCDKVVYCGEACRREAWEGYHKVICPSSPTTTVAMLYDVRKSFREVLANDGSTWQGWWNSEFSPILLARMYATIYSIARALAGTQCQPSKEDWQKAISKFEKYWYNEGTHATHAIPKMYDLVNTIFKRNKILRREISESNFNKRHQQLLCNYISFHDISDPLREFVDKVTHDKKLYKRIGKYFHEPLPKPEFHGLFPVASCLNHSCVPNAEVVSANVRGQPGIVVQALKDIDVLDEITIAYVHPAMIKMARRDILLKRYRFWCECIRCLFEGDGPEICSYCGKQAPGLTDTEVQTSKTAEEKPKIQMSSATEELIYVPPDDRDADLLTSSVENTDAKDKDDIKEISDSSVPISDNVGQGNSPDDAKPDDTLLSSADEVIIPKQPSKRNGSITKESTPVIPDKSISLDKSVSNRSSPNLPERTVITDKPRKKNKNRNFKASANKKGKISESNVKNLTYDTEHADVTVTSRSHKVDPEIASSTGDAIPAKTKGPNSEKTTSGETESKIHLRKRFPHCAKCGRAWYCSQACQKEAWKRGHKKICAKLF